MGIANLYRLFVLTSILLPLFGMAGLVSAAEPDKCVANLQFENDLFGSGDDSHYSHGSRFSFIVPATLDRKKNDCILLQNFLRKSANLLVKKNPLTKPLVPKTDRIVVSFGQNIFTPEDIQRRELIQDDRPYAGWTYVGFGFVRETKSATQPYLQNLELDIGVAGPSSYGREVQTKWHRLINVDQPKGWDHQLKDEIGVLLSNEWKWPSAKSTFFNHELDIAPSIGFALGNIYTYGSVGATLRFGDALPDDYGPPRIRPGLQGSGFYIPRKNFSWYFFLGLEGRAVGRNIFLDGNTFRKSHRVDKKTMVGDLQAGLVITWRDIRFAFTNVFRSKEFSGQKKFDEFGSFNISVRF